jgi:hypothetical protein
LLRSLYARRGADDATSVMTLAEVADHVWELMADAPESPKPLGSGPTA